MPLSNASRRSEKAAPYRLPSAIARGLEENLRAAKAGHFPIYDGDQIIGVFVSVDRFNTLVHLAELLDDPRIAAAISREPPKEENERPLSFEEVFGSWKYKKHRQFWGGDVPAITSIGPYMPTFHPDVGAYMAGQRNPDMPTPAETACLRSFFAALRAQPQNVSGWQSGPFGAPYNGIVYWVGQCGHVIEFWNNGGFVRLIRRGVYPWSLLVAQIFTYLLNHWHALVYLLGMIFEIIGALLIANRYLNMPWWSRLGVLTSAVYGGKLAQRAEAIAELSGERTKDALRGLGFLCLGFALRTLPSIAELLAK
jgi:hypothetical protein